MKAEKGFTLIEVIVYMAIIGVLLGSFVSLSIAQVEARNKVGVVSEVQANIRIITEHINRKVRESSQIVFPENASSSSQIILHSQESGEDRKYFLRNNQLFYQIGAGAEQQISSNQVALSSVLFENISYGDTESLKYSFVVSDKDSESKSFDYQEESEEVVLLRVK